jgi:hypothetical protein
MFESLDIFFNLLFKGVDFSADCCCHCPKICSVVSCFYA